MKVRIAAVFTVAALVVAATACGSRNDSGDPPSGSTTTQASAGELTMDDMFGTIESPCGPGDASGATDVGVTDDSITVYTYDDHEFGLAPGVNKGAGQAMDAFAQWCNAQGGINGRELKVEWKNTRGTAFKTQAVEPGCQNALALVGGINVFDETGAQAQVDCGLVNVPAAAVSPEQTGADLTFQPLPNPANTYLVGPAQWVQETFPEAAQNAAALALQTAVTDIQIKRQVAAYGSVGFNWIINDRVSLQDLAGLNQVLQMKNSGAEYMTYSGALELALPLFKTMRDQAYKPQVLELEANYYNLSYPPRAEGTMEDAYVRITVWPFEEADENPATAEFLEAMEVIPANDRVVELLGVQAFSAGLLFATAAKALGSNVTRAGLAEQLSQIHSWTGGGLHGQSDPGNNVGAPCFIMMQLKGEQYQRAYPTQQANSAVYESGNGFDCNPDNVVPLDLNAVGVPADRQQGAKRQG